MSGSIELTAKSLEVLARRYRTITHNMANANTVGFKRQIMSQSMVSQGDGTAETIAERTAIDFSQGRVVHTGRPLDVALNGKGFLVVETIEGEVYTRDGVLRTNAQSQLVDAGGRTVSGESGPIVIPPTAGTHQVQISSAGTVSVGAQTIGKLRIVEFDDPNLLVPIGANSFKAPDGVASKPAETTTVHQGFQEASNVNVVEELVDLITVTRLYEANIKSVTVQDEKMKNLLQVAMG